MPADKINYGDTLRIGTDKINDAIDAVNTFQTQINNVIINSGTSDAETIQARGGFDTVNERINNAELELADKATRAELTNVLDGSPKGTYATLSALQTAYPTGTTGVYLVTSDGHIYSWNGASWADLGLYQTTIIKDGVYAKNKIVNGNFVDISNWNAVSGSNGTLTAVNNELIYTVVGMVSTSRIQQAAFTPVVGHKYYVRGDIFPKYANTSYIQIGDSASLSNNSPTPNVWNKISGIITPISTTAALKFYHVTNVGYVAGDTFKFRRILVVDLTEVYGAGNEPSVSAFEDILLKFTNSWIDTSSVQLSPPQYLTDAFDSKLDKSAVSSMVFKNVITVKKDGTGDYTTLRSAISPLTGLTVDNQHEVQIYAGEWDVFSEYTQAEVEATNFVGLIIPKYVHLKGIGTRGSIHLKGDLPDTYAAAAKSRVATLATLDTGDLINLKVTARNLRYAVHDDYNYPNYERNVEDCDFIKYAGGGFNQAYGEGCWSGTKTIFKNCTFHTDTNGLPYSCHNNVNFTKPSFHRLEGCKFTNKAGLSAIRFGSMGSGQEDIIEMFNNKISGQILLSEEIVGSGVGIDFNLSGYGNDVVPIQVTHTHPTQQVVYDLLGETKELYNATASTILKGSLVRYDSYGTSIAPFLSADPTVRFVGVAMEDIPAGELGFVRIGGFLPIADTTLTGTSLGQKIGITNGALAVVSTGDYIGYVDVNNFIRLNRP